MARKAHSLTMLLSQIDQAYPRRSKVSDGWIGDASHQARRSDHNPDEDGVVHAIDVTHDPAGGFDAHKWIRTQLVPGRDSRLKYVISNGEVWDPVRGWHKYRGPNPHNHHVHVSVNDEGGDDERRWKLGISNHFKVVVDGSQLVGAFRNPQGLTFVPLRALAEALGCSVDFDEDTNTVTVRK